MPVTEVAEIVGIDRHWHGLGLWKFAVIAEGVARRTMDTPQNKAAAGTPTVERIDALEA
jgi:hypothetical protein